MVAVFVDYRIEYLHHSTPFIVLRMPKMRYAFAMRSHASDYQLDPDEDCCSGWFVWRSFGCRTGMNGSG